MEKVTDSGPKTSQAIKKILKSTSMRDYCLFTLGVNGEGMRISDLLRLRLAMTEVRNNKIRSPERMRRMSISTRLAMPEGVQNENHNGS